MAVLAIEQSFKIGTPGEGADTMRLRERNAIVTGGANGIGRAIALNLAQEGANVIVADIDSREANKVVDEIKSIGSKSMTITVDVTKMNEVKLMAKTALEEFKSIDILINNAGRTARERASLFCESTEDIWDQVFNLNLKGPFNCSRAIIKHMIRRCSGKIVNISSISGLVGTVGMVDYSAAKAGIIGFTMALAKEVASYKINVNAVAPGPIETSGLLLWMNRNRIEPGKFVQSTGLGRLGKPEDVATMVTFLTTDEANFITGQVFPVCGLVNVGIQ
jgi:NAD(P)-dependent dehydrogenase (short-subunit alcohol dehydrogenase family)